MTRQLRNDKELADRAERVGRGLVAAAQTLIGSGPRYTDKDRVTHVLAGWWVYCLRTGEAAFNLIKDGFVVQARPLLRLLIEHELTMAFVDQCGEEGLKAVICYGARQNKALLGKMKNAGWEGLDELEEEYAANDPAEVCGREHTNPRHGTLLGSVGNFENLTTAMDEQHRYVLYRDLSSYDHARLRTASAYAVQDESSNINIDWDNRESGYPEAIQTAVAVIVATHIISCRLVGDPLRVDIEQALTTLDLPTKDVAPRLRSR
ncbi:DUF5677 domain-containing protein (plasmid) [Streptomyces sp. SDT5-1]|uniref:DUF5677 domain-containing protein n=1 Tax=Streptomyces sp. SDT5-1 TaxID=3406418 RepID=UPI003FD420A7